jgi:NAD(P)-dependent dehydrogenase (short-subunit alcohol dehydrogenase family)
MGKLIGKIAVVTGGSSGIGLAAATRFAEEGATVYITGRRQAELDAAAAQIGHGAVAVQTDISRLEDLDRLFEIVKSQAGRIDVLFANAGGGEFATLEEITEAHFDAIFGTNVKGTVFTVQKALPLMGEGGSIILTGSTTSVLGTPAFSIYSATKAAVRNLARSWTLDLKGRGIRVNVLAPGATATPGLQGLAPTAGDYKAFTDVMISQIPLGRMGRPEEIAGAALFLASDDSSYVNGAELFVDGGFAQV